MFRKPSHLEPMRFHPSGDYRLKNPPLYISDRRDYNRRRLTRWLWRKLAVAAFLAGAVAGAWLWWRVGITVKFFVVLLLCCWGLEAWIKYLNKEEIK